MMNPSSLTEGRLQERRNGIPLYAQLREALRSEIKERELRPGDRLPTEAELEERYGVSRSTIRQAVGDLEIEGLLRRVQGRGTFVGSPKIQHHPVLMSFSGLLRSQGYAPSHRLLDTDVVGAPPAVAADLELDEGTPCRRVERLLSADDDPVGVSKTWLPLAVLGEHDGSITAGVTAGGSLYELLGDASPGLAPARASETIDPALADEEEAGLLGCEPGTPLLFIRRRSWTATGLPLESTQLLFLPGRYQYRVELEHPAVRESHRG